MVNTDEVLDGVVEPIRTRMLAADFSINSLATAALLPYTSLRRKLLNPEQMTMGDLLRIADALGCRPDVLFPIVPLGAPPATAARPHRDSGRAGAREKASA